MTDEKPDLTVRKIFEALELINGRWISQKQAIEVNKFWCSSNGNKISYKVHEQIKKLGFEDVIVKSSSDGTFDYEFIWKIEVKKAEPKKK